jgi:hypothetical protein
MPGARHCPIASHMHSPLPRILIVFALLALVPLPALAQKADAVPKPETYLCPHASGGAVDCFLQAVEHLYTMCRQVKSIEIIEFGYAKAQEGVNGAKSEYCVDKHKLSMARPYQAALREATPSRVAVDGLRALRDLWLNALAELKWKPGENDEEYKARIAMPYDTFRERASAVRAALSAPKGKTATAAAAPVAAKSTN